MKRAKEPEGWTWIPCETRTQDGRRATGGLVLAIACLSIGIVVGRVSVSTETNRTAEHTTALVQVPVPAAPEASLEPNQAPEPERLTDEASPPPSVFGSEPREEKQAGVLFLPAPIDAPLSSYTPSPASPSARGKGGRRLGWDRASSKRRSSSRRSHPVGQQMIGSSRDYQALRDYVLSR
jgi:hypothetical protein